MANQTATMRTVRYNGQSYDYPAELTAAEVLAVAKRRHPELGANAVISQDGTALVISEAAQRKSAQGVAMRTVRYNGQSYDYPADLTAAEVLAVAKRRHPELGANAVISQDGTALVISEAAQRKSAAAEMRTVRYNGQSYDYPAELTAAEVLAVAKRRHPELGANAVISQDGTALVISEAAQRKSVQG